MGLAVAVTNHWRKAHWASARQVLHVPARQASAQWQWSVLALMRVLASIRAWVQTQDLQKGRS